MDKGFVHRLLEVVMNSAQMKMTEAFLPEEVPIVDGEALKLERLERLEKFALPNHDLYIMFKCT